MIFARVEHTWFQSCEIDVADFQVYLLPRLVVFFSYQKKYI